MTVDTVRALVAADLARPADPEIQAVAEQLATRPGVVAVLFYGARRRAAKDRGGPLDFYLLTESDAAYHGPGLAAWANRLLPPNVYAERIEGEDAKIAVITLTSFHHRMRPKSWDTTLWARFSQPATLAWCRDARTRAAVEAAIAAATETALHWASRLTPDPADPATTWQALHRATYAAELRVEGADRVAGLFARHEDRYRRLHALLDRGADPFTMRGAAGTWAGRAVVGKLLNAARLIKGAFTYRGGLTYLGRKIDRHAGRHLPETSWARRHPVLSAPYLLWRTWRHRPPP
ncbi:MAG: hypothetical protein AAF577_08855 [Pseudomonadota bacterium]